MAERNINYKQVLDNVKEMISLLEFDAMRSAGKAKLNCGHLESLYNLKDRYEAMLKPVPEIKEEKATPAAKTTAAKASK